MADRSHRDELTGRREAPVPRERAEAVVAWRYWQLTPAGRLRSISQRRFVWPAGRPLRATCILAAHVPPAPGCRCGVYGAVDLPALRAHDLCLSADPLVVGEVALWGEVLRDHEGYRGEVGRPVALWLVADTAPDGADRAILEELGRYGSVRGTMRLDDAVSEISGALIAHEAMSRGIARA